VQANLDQVAKEKEALRNWQMAKQHESQRISEVIELCAKQPASIPVSSSQAAVPGASVPSGPTPPQPEAASKASAGH
jgi:hypothetical protein